MAQEKPVLKSRQEIAIMRESGRIVAATLEMLVATVRPGMTTADLDQLAHDYIRSRGAVPSFKGYQGFPGSICASVNEEIVHGIPGSRVLVAGDLLKLDCGAFYRGFHSDSATTVVVGGGKPELDAMIAIGWEALAAGIEQARPGKRVEDISATIQAVLLEHGYGVVGDGLAGHGVGRKLHESPTVPNHGTAGQGIALVPGMTIAIEPMYTQGNPRWRMLNDGWTVVSRDRSLAAHVEHTVAITEGAPEILTLP